MGQKDRCCGTAEDYIVHESQGKREFQKKENN